MHGSLRSGSKQSVTADCVDLKNHPLIFPSLFFLLYFIASPRSALANHSSLLSNWLPPTPLGRRKRLKSSSSELSAANVLNDQSEQADGRYFSFTFIRFCDLAILPRPVSTLLLLSNTEVLLSSSSSLTHFWTPFVTSDFNGIAFVCEIRFFCEVYTSMQDRVHLFMHIFFWESFI